MYIECIIFVTKLESSSFGTWDLVICRFIKNFVNHCVFFDCSTSKYDTRDQSYKITGFIIIVEKNVREKKPKTFVE